MTDLITVIPQNLILVIHIVGLFANAKPQQIAAEPSRPSLVKEGIGDDHFNLTFVPGRFEIGRDAPVGNAFAVRYREADTDDAWLEKRPTDKSTLQVVTVY